MEIWLLCLRRRISSSSQAEWRLDKPMAASTALHQEVVVPVLRKSQGEVYAELFAANSCAPINEALYSTMCWQGCALPNPWNLLSSTRGDRGRP